MDAAARTSPTRLGSKGALRPRQAFHETDRAETGSVEGASVAPEEAEKRRRSQRAVEPQFSPFEQLRRVKTLLTLLKPADGARVPPGREPDVNRWIGGRFGSCRTKKGCGAAAGNALRASDRPAERSIAPADGDRRPVRGFFRGKVLLSIGFIASCTASELEKVRETGGQAALRQSDGLIAMAFEKIIRAAGGSSIQEQGHDWR